MARTVLVVLLVGLVLAPAAFAKGPALSVGTGEPPKDYVAFPVGSEAAHQGGGGELVTDGGDGVPVWLFPLLGVALAGVGAAAASRRGSR